MRAEKVEIYSDVTNAAVMRHPDRRFPGVLIQGDTLYTMWQQADVTLKAIGPAAAGIDELAELEELRDRLWSFIEHYKEVLDKHEIELPF